MNLNRNTYADFAQKRARRSPCRKNCLHAFLVGGAICTAAQGLTALWGHLGVARSDAGTLTAVTLIFTAAWMTGFGVFDRIARFAGAGTLVPITGFANAVVSPAIDTRAEGWILGVGVKMFSVAGPVIVYGIVSGTVYGVVYWITTLL